MPSALICPDSFKGSLSSKEVAKAIADSYLAKYPDSEVHIAPLSDGGDGFINALRDLPGTTVVSCETFDPLMRPIETQFLLRGETAIIEMASAAGLALLSNEERNPLHTTSFGFGILIKRAMQAGARTIIVGLGGSATNDAGLGALQALGAEIVDYQGATIHNGITGGDLLNVLTIKPPRHEFLTAKIIIASDVNAPLFGPQGAAYIFAPQKGASPNAVRTLDSGLQHIASLVDCLTPTAGYGAAGGMAFALHQFLNSEIVNGVDLVMQMLDFYSLAAKSDVIITGEGAIDEQTAMGKVVQGVVECARTINRAHTERQIEVFALAGIVRKPINGCTCIQITPPDMPLQQAMLPSTTKENIHNAIMKNL